MVDNEDVKKLESRVNALEHLLAYTMGFALSGIDLKNPQTGECLNALEYLPEVIPSELKNKCEPIVATARAWAVTRSENA